MQVLFCMFFTSGLLFCVLSSTYFLYFSNWKDAQDYAVEGKKSLYQSLMKFVWSSFLLFALSLPCFVLSLFVKSSGFWSAFVLFVLQIYAIYLLYQVSSSLLKIAKQSHFRIK